MDRIKSSDKGVTCYGADQKTRSQSRVQNIKISPLQKSIPELTTICNKIDKMPAPAHLISKFGDPIFAFFIGLSAAATRINREEKELGHSTEQTIDAGLRYLEKFVSER